MEGQMRANPERSHVYDQEAVTAMPLSGEYTIALSELAISRG